MRGQSYIQPLAIGVILSVFSSMTQSQQPNEVSFAQAFSYGSLGAAIVINVPSDKILVFDGAGPYVLDGRDLLVFAERAVVRSKSTIRSYAENSVAEVTGGNGPDQAAETTSDKTGRDGNPGADGKKGAASGRLVFLVNQLQFDAGATLTILGEGQRGGPGQNGGPGGQGGPGSPGAKAGGVDSPCPGGGNAGGAGGRRGSGGIGGEGGAGGTVLLSKALAMAYGQSLPHFSISVNGGPKGAPGAPGEPGVGGPGGPRGAGSTGAVVVCTNPPDDIGPVGPQSTLPALDTPEGSDGEKGAIISKP